MQLKNHPVETEELYRRMSRRKTDVSFDMNGTTIEKEDRSSHQSSMWRYLMKMCYS